MFSEFTQVDEETFFKIYILKYILILFFLVSVFSINKHL